MIAVNQTYNLAGMRAVTIKETTEVLKRLIGNVTIEYKEARPGDYSGALVSNDKAKRKLGWEPKVDFEEGLKKYIEWFRRTQNNH